MSINNNISVICEIASAHGGDADALKKLLIAADDSNSDWVKVQIFQFESLVSDENNSFSELKQIELSVDEWIDVIDFSNQLQPKLIAEVFDFPSLKLVEHNHTVKAFKIPTADLGDRSFVDAVCSIGKPIFIGIGGATLKEIDAIVKQVLSYDIDLVLLHGIQNFPTKLEDSLLNKIQLLYQRYQCQVGFADHIDAENLEMVKILPAMAVASGASVIEKHITLDRSQQGFDYYSSLNPDEFKDFVKFIKNSYVAIGSVELETLTNAEKNYRNKMKKFAVLDDNVLAGDKVKNSAVQYRRTSLPGITRKEFEVYDKEVFNLSLTKGVILNEKYFD